MGASLTTVDAILKEVYGPRIVGQLENEIILTKRIEKTSRGTTSEVGGKYVTFPLKVRRNHGIGYRNELEQLQNAGQQGWQNVRVPLRYGYGRVHMSGQSMALVNENYQAFASAMTEEMTGLKDDIAKDTNRILWGDHSGLMYEFGAEAASNELPVTSGFGFVEIGQKVDIMDVSAGGGATVAVQREVVSYDDTNETVTIDGAPVTTEAGDFAVRTGNYNKEPHGLRSLVTDGGSLFNLDSADEPLWKSLVDTTGGALSESKMIATCDKLKKKGGRPSVIFTDLGTNRAYFNLLTTQRRFTNTKDFEGGFSGLAFSYGDEIPVVTDVDAVEGSMYFLREDDFKIYHHKDWHWEDTDGNIWKWVTNFDAFEALMKKYWEFAIERRNTQAVMTDITPG